jgi:hypothetical protein
VQRGQTPEAAESVIGAIPSESFRLRARMTWPGARTGRWSARSGGLRARMGCLRAWARSLRARTGRLRSRTTRWRASIRSLRARTGDLRARNRRSRARYHRAGAQNRGVMVESGKRQGGWGGFIRACVVWQLVSGLSCPHGQSAVARGRGPVVRFVTVGKNFPVGRLSRLALASILHVTRLAGDRCRPAYDRGTAFAKQRRWPWPSRH